VVPANGVDRLVWKNLADDPRIRRVAVGDKIVPAGRYTWQAFTRLGIGEAVRPKLVPCSDVRQALTYVSLGEVDAAAVYATDAKAARRKVRVVDKAPPGSHEPIVYPIAVVKSSKQQGLARRWIDLVVSDAGQRILDALGFLPRRRRT
jgi:molybdate transport system substrate-binding protein